MVIRIGGIDYEVEEVPNLCTEDGAKRLNGDIFHDRCQIRVDQNLSPQIKSVTVWHEIIHGILTQAGARKQDETQIEALAYGIVQVLRDNPQLLEMKK